MIERAKRNDQSAVTALYRCTYHSTYYTVKALIKDEDTAEDIIQDSYIKIFRNLYRLKKPENCKAWIQMVARNTAIDHLRRRKPILFSDITSLDTEDPANLPETSPENLPEVVVDRKETKRLMKKILKEIPEEQRIVIMMYYYEQIPVKRIAKELGISEGTVKSRLNYGRKKIEEKVLQLAKKGTKLYGLTAIPFLGLVLRSWSAVPVKPSSAVLRNILAVLYGSQEASRTAGALSVSGSAARASARLSLLSSTQNAVTAAKITAGICIISVIGGTAVGTIAEQYREQPLSTSYTNTTAKPAKGEIGYNRAVPYAPAGVQENDQTWYEEPVQTYYTQEYIQDDPADEDAPAQQEEAAQQAQDNAPAQTGGTQQTPAQAAGGQAQIQTQPTNSLPREAEQEETRAPVDNPLDDYVGLYRAYRNQTGEFTGSMDLYRLNIPDAWGTVNSTIAENVYEDTALGNYMQLSFLYRDSANRASEVFSLRLISTNVSVTDSSYTKVAESDTFNVYRVPVGTDKSLSRVSYDELSGEDKTAYDTLLGTADNIISSFSLL